MKLLTIAFLLLLKFSSSAQESSKIRVIDSLAEKAKLKTENYRYVYGWDGKNIIDFRMDSVQGELIRVLYRPEVAKTFLVSYYFQNNYLIKVEIISLVDSSIISKFYFDNNKVFAKRGRNYKTHGQGFGKISPKNIYKQLDYIYYQFEFFNMANRKPYKNPPQLLEKKREEIQRDYHLSEM